jgi:V/A-type H+-transporting ATPase subunit F
VSFHVIGAEEVVLGFRFVGIPGTVARTEEEAREAFRAVTSAGTTRVLILTEQVSGLIAGDVMDWQLGGAYPLVVEIPGLEGHRPDRVSLLDSIRSAVGIQV